MDINNYKLVKIDKVENDTEFADFTIVQESDWYISTDQCWTVDYSDSDKPLFYLYDLQGNQIKDLDIISKFVELINQKTMDFKEIERLKISMSQIQFRIKELKSKYNG